MKIAGNTLPKGSSYPFNITYKHHQNIGIAESGKTKVYDRGVTETFIGVIFNNYNNSDISVFDVDNFIRNTAVYSKNTFTFEDDLGNSYTVRYWNDEFIDSMHAYLIHKYDLILRVEI